MQEQNINVTSTSGVLNAEKDKEVEQVGEKFNTITTDLLANLERGEGPLVVPSPFVQSKGRCQCQPCLCCGISLGKSALIAAIIFTIVGLYFTMMSTAFVVLSDMWNWSGRIFFVVLFLLICSIAWLTTSVALIIGVKRKSKCLIRIFLWVILSIPLIMLLLGIFYTMISLAEANHCLGSHEVFHLLQVLYFLPFVLALLGWYLYWIVYAFYLKCGGRSCCRCTIQR